MAGVPGGPGRPRHVRGGPSLPFRGDWFIHDYVLLELAHRHKDEVLLWDGFGAMTDDLAGADLTLVDEVAALLVAADRGDTAAGRELARRYASDARLRPGPTVHCMDPVSGTAADVDLRR